MTDLILNNFQDIRDICGSLQISPYKTPAVITMIVYLSEYLHKHGEYIEPVIDDTKQVNDLNLIHLTEINKDCDVCHNTSDDGTYCDCL